MAPVIEASSTTRRRRARFHLGWLFLDQGREDEGLAAMRTWVDRCREIRECLIPNYLGWLAEALAAVARSSNHYWTAELHRLRTSLVDSDERADSSLHDAIAIAQRQNAKTLELRAALDLARLWARCGRAREAQALLADVHGWFAEGSQSADLADASALLGELASASSRTSRARGGRRNAAQQRVDRER